LYSNWEDAVGATEGLISLSKAFPGISAPVAADNYLINVAGLESAVEGYKDLEEFQETAKSLIQNVDVLHQLGFSSFDLNFVKNLDIVLSHPFGGPPINLNPGISTSTTVKGFENDPRAVGIVKLHDLTKSLESFGDIMTFSDSSSSPKAVEQLETLTEQLEDFQNFLSTNNEKSSHLEVVRTARQAAEGVLSTVSSGDHSNDMSVLASAASKLEEPFSHFSESFGIGALSAPEAHQKSAKELIEEAAALRAKGGFVRGHTG